MGRKRGKNPAEQSGKDPFHVLRQYTATDKTTNEKRIMDEVIHERLIRKGMHYSKLETCIHISILNFNLSEGDGLYSEIGLINVKNGNLYSDKFSFRVLYLNHINDASDEEKQTDIYKWARLISAKDWAELEEIAACNEYMKEAYSEMEKINSNKTLRYNYLREEMEESDRNTLRLGGYLEGKAEGIAAGEARVSQLVLRLFDEKRYDDLERVLKDKSYRDELLKQYEI